VRRLPIFATLIVMVAVATMLSLGRWQLARAVEKESLLARYQNNLQASPLRTGQEVELGRDLFRKATATCSDGARPTWLEGAGRYGFRVLADCLTLSGGQRLVVQLGTAGTPTPTGEWQGGAVSGYLTTAPEGRSLLSNLFSHSVPTPMIVADPPLAGYAANPGPSLTEVPNNHRSYAFQWFAFAAAALIIYGLALRGRRRGRT
jgi:surfeit locus 1 family protein